MSALIKKYQDWWYKNKTTANINLTLNLHQSANLLRPNTLFIFVSIDGSIPGNHLVFLSIRIWSLRGKKSLGRRSGEYGGSRTWECCPYPQTVAQAIDTDKISVVWRDDHTLHPFFPNTRINTGSENGITLCEFVTEVKDNLLPSSFILRSFSSFIVSPSPQFLTIPRLYHSYIMEVWPTTTVSLICVMHCLTMRTWRTGD